MKNPVLERLRRYGIQPRKELGQHFLIDNNVLDRIVDVLAPSPERCIVEFGAGIGVLTERLLAAGARVIAVELDDDLAVLLERELGGREGFRLLHADLAGIDLAVLHRDSGVERLQLAGNLPYQLTSRVLFGVLELREHLDDAVFMVQREVAERIVASPGGRDYGILSVLLNAYHHVRIAVRVKPGSFAPAPRVQSAVIHVVPRGEDSALEWDECAGLIRLVKSVFNERRKTLRNTLKKFYALESDALHAVASASGLDLGRRPETLSVDEFVALLRALPAAAPTLER